MQNIKETNASELFDLLDSISKYFERKVKMYALGGTALTILGIKPSTVDIDINADVKDHTYIFQIFEQIGFKKLGGIRWQTQEGLSFDLFSDCNIMGTHLLDDALTKSKFIKSFGNIELYTFSFNDIIISKLARGDGRDFQDIKHIFEKNKIDLIELVKRYKETMEQSAVANSNRKLMDLIEFKFRDWGFRLDRKMIERVKKWP
ncbi:hypothetical protein HYY72_01315 [Candidatus Woesearchaeota archaeon]|nr:hypothetical protein [Candidatus Woesearchaeota archaeon]